jgi:agmatine deiminase
MTGGKMKKSFGIAIMCILLGLGMLTGCAGGSTTQETSDSDTYVFPDENQKHEGTWLIWPHAHTYGRKYARSIEPIWISMTKALADGEHVHIIAYDESLKRHITSVLKENNVNTSNVSYIIAKSDDVWARDTGPMFVKDSDGDLHIADFGFDGWGGKMPYKKDDDIPKAVSKALDMDRLDISQFVLEGGSVEIASDGTMLAAKSSVISKNRNPDVSQKEAEAILSKYLGVKKFIWLEGVTDEDITDGHIDGFARFYDKDTILTVPENDFYDLYENIREEDYETLTHSTNASGRAYDIIEIPLTKKNVKGLDYKGSYLNFYLGNEVLLLPVYGDDNDGPVIRQMKELYPDHEIVPINVTALYKNGGMLHCVTQQMPTA